MLVQAGAPTYGDAQQSIPAACYREGGRPSGAIRVKLRARARARARLRVKRLKSEAAKQAQVTDKCSEKVGIVKVVMVAAAAASASIAAMQSTATMHEQFMSCLDQVDGDQSFIPHAGLIDELRDSDPYTPSPVLDSESMRSTVSIVRTLPLPSQDLPIGVKCWDTAAGLVASSHPGRRPGIGDIVRLRKKLSHRKSLLPALKHVTEIGRIIDDDPDLKHVPYHVMGPCGDVGFAGPDDIEVLEASVKTGRPAGTDAAYWQTRIAQIQEESYEQTILSREVDMPRANDGMDIIATVMIGMVVNFGCGRVATVATLPSDGWVKLKTSDGALYEMFYSNDGRSLQDQLTTCSPVRIPPRLKFPSRRVAEPSTPRFSHSDCETDDGSDAASEPSSPSSLGGDSPADVW